jgi:hypothetical protein
VTGLAGGLKNQKGKDVLPINLYFKLKDGIGWMDGQEKFCCSIKRKPRKEKPSAVFIAKRSLFGWGVLTDVETPQNSGADG